MIQLLYYVYIDQYYTIGGVKLDYTFNLDCNELFVTVYLWSLPISFGFPFCWRRTFPPSLQVRCVIYLGLGIFELSNALGNIVDQN